jgi:hypothetical protein
MDRYLYIWMPVAAAAVVGVILAGLGLIFIQIGTKGTIGVGVAIVVVVPLVAALYLRMRGPERSAASRH